MNYKSRHSYSIFRMDHVNHMIVLAFCLILMAGCAFDISSYKQEPVTFKSTQTIGEFTLKTQAVAHFGTGFPTTLRAGTRWKQIGATEYGSVFSTRDQIVKVEASNISEACIVVSNNSLVGFFLPVEKTFVRLSSAIPLDFAMNQQ